MGDEQNYPTAIVPTRPGPAHERFDRLAEQFGDPMTTLFITQSPLVGSKDEELRVRAAAELMPYRYAKLRTSELNVNAQGAGNVNIQINIGAAPPPPPPPALPPAARAQPVLVPASPVTPVTVSPDTEDLLR
jgi:hypothetical protein